MYSRSLKERRVLLKNELHSEVCTPAIGVYDVISARLVEQAGFPVAYIGSYAVAASTLGEPDTGLNSLNDIVEQAKLIADAVNIPLIADAEGGFNRPANIWRTIRDFERAGACAIHIEDHVFGKHTEFPMILSDINIMCNKIRASVDAREDDNFLIIARTEAYYAYKDRKRCDEETVERCNKYLEAGADAVFISTIHSAETMKEIRKQINGPVVIPASTQSAESIHQEVGINMALYWQFCLYAAYVGCKEALTKFKEHLDYRDLGKYIFDEKEFNKTINYAAFLDRIKKYGLED